jgi:catechol 2,3-dioxygenase-like lactoylglutathione lyase family enzyme
VNHMFSYLQTNKNKLEMLHRCAFSIMIMLYSCSAFALTNLPHQRSGKSSPLYAFGNPETPVHHLAIRTRDIEMAIQFYSLLDFEVETKFLAGTVRAAWLRQEKGNSEGVRIELIEVPKGILRETEGTRQRAIDLSTRLDLLGLNHYALDVTSSIKGKGMKDLKAWIDFINEKSMMKFGKTLRIAVEPQDQMIGQYLYQLAFIYDYDGALIELLNRRKRFSQQMVSGWYV